MQATLNRYRMSPKKANVVAGLVRGMAADKALDMLKFTPKKPAVLLYKVLYSAVANSGKSADQLKVDAVIINKGPFYKRHLPSTRGRALPIQKPTTNVTIKLAPLS